MSDPFHLPRTPEPPSVRSLTPRTFICMAEAFAKAGLQVELWVL